MIKVSFEMAHITAELDTHGIATLTIAHPERFNAMRLSMWQQLASHRKRLSDDPLVRVVVVRGEGERAFVSGADISEFDVVRASPDDVEHYDQSVESAEAAVANCVKPVIAAISGICFGGGVGIAMACDLRYANDSARFCLPAAKLGLGYSLEDVARLRRVLGRAVTAEMIMTAREYRGSEACDAGFVHAIVDDVFEHVQHQARRIATLAPLTLRALKLALQHTDDNLGVVSKEAVREAVGLCFSSADYTEGREAFAQKRPPVFSGR
jgi:enoyl-CoA hydratase/carnithine racemase